MAWPSLALLGARALKNPVEFVLRKFRLALRLTLLALVFAGAGMEHLLLAGWRWSQLRRSSWLLRWSRIFLKVLAFRVRVEGEIPERGFIAPNHQSYMDIVALASITRQVFLSKLEVRDWPIVGHYTKVAGTLFIDRRRRSDVLNRSVQFGRIVDAGLRMTFFLEGTTSDGSVILPFRSSLLQTVVSGSWPITPSYIKYTCNGGSVEQDVCWWGEMGFASHLYRLLQVKSVSVEIRFGRAISGEDDRKALAKKLQRSVEELSRV